MDSHAEIPILYARPFEPSHEIMALFVLRKLILQTRMRSHVVGLDVWFLGHTLRLFPYYVCANSEGSGETARLRRLAWAFAGRLCDKYHYLMSWLILMSLSYRGSYECVGGLIWFVLNYDGLKS